MKVRKGELAKVGAASIGSYRKAHFALRTYHATPKTYPRDNEKQTTPHQTHAKVLLIKDSAEKRHVLRYCLVIRQALPS